MCFNAKSNGIIHKYLWQNKRKPHAIIPDRRFVCSWAKAYFSRILFEEAWHLVMWSKRASTLDVKLLFGHVPWDDGIQIISIAHQPLCEYWQNFHWTRFNGFDLTPDVRQCNYSKDEDFPFPQGTQTEDLEWFLWHLCCSGSNTGVGKEDGKTIS